MEPPEKESTKVTGAETPEKNPDSVISPGHYTDGQQAELELRTRELRETKQELENLRLLYMELDNILEDQAGHADLTRISARQSRAEHMARLGYFDWDAEKDLVTWSGNIANLYPEALSRLAGSKHVFLEMVHPEDRKAAEAALQKLLQTGSGFPLDIRVVLPEGSCLDIRIQARVLRGRDARPIKVEGTYQDITEQKEAEGNLRELSRRLYQILEEERYEIAQELHDEVGQSLSFLKLMLDRALKSGDKNLVFLERASTQLLELIQRTRDLYLELRPPMLEDLGLTETLSWHIQRFTEQTGIPVTIKETGLERKLSRDSITTSYRLVQEALNAIVPGRGLDPVIVTILADKEISIRVEARDRELSDEHIKPGSYTGLSGMRERIRLLGGTVTWQCVPESGICIQAAFPSREADPA